MTLSLGCCNEPLSHIFVIAEIAFKILRKQFVIFPKKMQKGVVKKVLLASYL